MIAIKFSGGWGFRSVRMDVSVVFFEILYDPFSYKMGRDVIRNNGEFKGVSDGMDDAMSNDSGDSGGEDDVETEDISVLISELVF